MLIRPISEDRCRLGEGPLWDAAAEQLYWVDSLAPALFRFDYASGETRRWELPGTSIGSVALRERGGLLLAMARGFYFFDPASDKIELVAEPLAARPELRLNDGKVDPFGAFVSGAMSIDYLDRVAGPMLRLTPEFEVQELLPDFECFNGPCFSADGARLYVTGRSLEAIETYDYHPRAVPANGRVLIDGCCPDGATVDADGYIWSAQWDRECLLRLAPDGDIDFSLPLPGHIVSSVMFGGPELDVIFVTTVGGEVHGARPRGVNPGRTLAIEGSGYRGRPEPRFKG